MNIWLALCMYFKRSHNIFHILPPLSSSIKSSDFIYILGPILFHFSTCPSLSWFNIVLINVALYVSLDIWVCMFLGLVLPPQDQQMTPEEKCHSTGLISTYVPLSKIWPFKSWLLWCPPMPVNLNLNFLVFPSGNFLWKI